MSTYNELASLVLDITKEISDDSKFTKDHAIFMLSKYRGYILNSQYATMKKVVAESNYQKICVDLECDNLAMDFCGKIPMLRSIKKIPKTMQFCTTVIYPMAGFNYGNFIHAEYRRFTFSGNSKFLRNTVYTTIGPDGYLYVKSSNPNIAYLKKIQMYSVFEDNIAASLLECTDDENGNCDVLEKNFPLEDAFQETLVQMVVRDMMVGVYNTKDNNNNANDDLAELGNLIDRYTNSRFKKLRNPEIPTISAEDD